MTKSNKVSFHNRRNFERIVFLLILPVLLFGCNFPTTKNNLFQDRPQVLESYPPPFVGEGRKRIIIVFTGYYNMN
jgi:hypothetical protein